MESILTSIKKLAGMTEDYDAFDTDLIIFINSVFSALTQIGVGPSSGFSISDDTAVWSDFMGEDPRLEFVKTYVHLKVRLVFDPPDNASVLKAYEQQIEELEWRINVAAESS